MAVKSFKRRVKDIRNKILDKESQTVQERLQGIRKFLKELLEHEQLN